MALGRLRLSPLLLAGLAAAAWAVPASGQVQVSDGTPIQRVEIQGLTSVSEAYVRRLITTREGQPYSERQVREDVRALQRTRKFLSVSADAALEEGRAVVTFVLQEKPAVTRLEIVGAKEFTVDELEELLSFASGDPLDVYAVNRGREEIERKYKEDGYYYVSVQIDPDELAQGAVVYRVVEGPRVRVREIEFEGNQAFPNAALRARVTTRKAFWIFIKGEFDEDRAERDALAIQTFYRERGYLDARVGYRLEFDEVERGDLRLVFTIIEGVEYRVNEISFEGNTAFTDEELRADLALAPGDVARDDLRLADIRTLTDKYGSIGYVDARVNARFDFIEDQPNLVNLRISIAENKQSRFGRIVIRGNANTKDKVVRRELRFYPPEWYDTVATRRAERRLRDTALFSSATITPGEDEEGFREALVEVEEASTINFLIGGGISTDSGVVGSVTIENRNFDLFDWPRSFGEFIRGQAFRGAGQRFRIQAEPGTEVSQFRIDFEEPYLLDMPVRLGLSAYLFQRDRGPYDEQRIGTTASLGRRFESGLLEGWAVEGALRLEGIDIDDVDALASRQIRDVKGNHTLTSLKGTIVRDTTDSRMLPSEGYRLSFSWEQVGALGGDFSFGKPTASAAWYKTLRTDIFERKSILAVRGDVGYITGDAPVFERFYAGGFGSIRGFDFRGVTPRAGIFDDPVGGDFIVLTGAEYSFPLYSKTLRGVTFIDMGTVEEDFGITSWRVAVGFGFRLHLDFFGPVPLVFDFGFPIADDDDDSTRVFNFSIGASF